jgi:type II secretory pathway component HofQ
MVANQVPQPATNASADEEPEPDPASTAEPLPPPPDDISEPSEDAESQIRRDEGDDSLVINLKDEDIRAVLELLGQYGELNILPSKNVTGRVSATLNGVDVRTALKAILKSTGHVARFEENFVYVGTPEDFKSMDQAQDVVGTRIYRPNYVTATELQTLITHC